MAEAGWYRDAQEPSLLRYYDGQAWTPHTRPTPPAAPPIAPPAAPLTAPQAGWAGAHPQAQVPPPNPQQYGQQQPPPTQPWQQPYPQQPQQSTQQFPPAGAYAPPPGPAAPGPQLLGPQPSGPAPRGPRDRKPLVIAVVAVLIVAAGLITFFAVSGSDAPKFTYRGKAIAAPAKVLTAAEAKVGALVARDHGRKGADTRCYFAQPKKAAKGVKKTDVDSNLRCGPVLFVDGDPAREYLPVLLRRASAKGGQVTLSTGSPAVADPVAVAPTTVLARPDGKKSPAGRGGLSVPAPPAADTNALLTTQLGSTPAPRSLTGAVMSAKSTEVALTAAGVITRYDTGQAARSAPAGQQLIAFRVQYTGGDVSSAANDTAALTVPGAAARPLPRLTSSDQWIVAAVPASGGAAVTLTADGYSQTLALPDGKPGSGNLAVLTRTHRADFLLKSFGVPVKLSKKGASASTTLHARATLASLNFWAPGHPDQHAGSVHDGLLSLALDYTTKGSKTTFGFDPRLLRLRLPNGHVVGARNVAARGKVRDVFEVPAGFTRGTLQITGAYKSGSITLRVKKTVSVAVSIPAG